MKLTRITAEHFLGIRRADIVLRTPICLIAGQNGAGKSSLSEAVRMALTSEAVRVGLKKDYPALVTDGARTGFAEVTIDGAGAAAITLPAGKTSGQPSAPALPYVLDAQRFAQLDAKERRAFLFGLMGLKMDAASVKDRLTARGCEAKKVEAVLPLLRAGFDAACKDAKAKATEAKGAWRAATGDTYGSEKAKTWRAPVPACDGSASKQVATELQHVDVAIDSWQQQVGKLQAEEQRRAGLRAKLPGLQEHAAKIERIQAKLATDEQQLGEWEADLAKTAAAAGAGPRIGLIHDLAAAVAYLLPLAQTPISEQPTAEECNAEAALNAYERDHGPVSATGGDEKARARLPSIKSSRDLLAGAVANDKRDLEAAQRAQAERDSISAELAEVFDAAALADARTQAEQLKATRAELVKRADAQKAAKAAADAAEKKTSEAAAHAADVAAWDAVGDALAPDGIPAEILSEALGPINERLMQSSIDAEWPRVGVDPDMSINVGFGESVRSYALLSESERWRVDAMIAEAIAHLSGVRLLVLDRFDVLDAKGRSDCLAWLDVLATNGEIDTALVFATLKALPSGLPPTIAAEWIDAGSVGVMREAA